MPAFAKAGRVELGVCGAANDFVKAEKWGFDYYEPSAAVIAAMSDTDFAGLRDRILSSSIRCRSFNSLIRTMKVVGPDVNLDAVSAYLDSTFDRCHQLGAKVAVWGSASSRNIPDGASREQTWSQIKTFSRPRRRHREVKAARHRDRAAAQAGIEHHQYRRRSSRLVHEVNHPHVKMIIDYYHMRVENEDPEIVRTAREHIVHMHFANPTGRRWPRQASEDPVYGRFFQIVKEVGYSGGLSIEGNGKFEDDADASLKFFHEELD